MRLFLRGWREVYVVNNKTWISNLLLGVNERLWKIQYVKLKFHYKI